MIVQTCINIFIARILDVSIGTVRTFFSVKGKYIKASMLAFVEVFIWFMVAREALNTDIDSIFIPVSYSLGYATGTLIGTFVSKNFIKGFITVQVITSKDISQIIKDAGYGVSILDVKKGDEKRDLLLIEVSKKNLKHLIELIKKEDNKAFIMTNETQFVQNGFIK